MRVVTRTRTAASRTALFCLGIVVSVSGFATAATKDDALFTLEHAGKQSVVLDARISPDGTLVAYTVWRQRTLYEGEDGPAWTELHVTGHEPEKSRPFVTGSVNVSAVDWSPNGQTISFLAKRGDDEKKALWMIAAAGGEARKVVSHDEDISAYGWSPDGSQIAFLAVEKRPEEFTKLEEKGFLAEVYEENLRPVRVWIVPLTPDGEAGEPRLLELEGSASELHWSPVDHRLAVALAPTPLIDDHYMKRKVHVVDIESGTVVGRIDHPGKLGVVQWSPDGKRIGLLAGEDLNDPNAGRLMIAPATGGSPKNLLAGFEGDAVAFDFRDADTLIYVAHQGVISLLKEIPADGGPSSTLLTGGDAIWRSLSLSKSGDRAALVGDSPSHPEEVFFWQLGMAEPTRVSQINPWLADIELARQEIISYEARDGLQLEGLLIRPANEEKDVRHPLIVVVHGGPESHYSNGWLTSYSRPGQFGASAGFAMFYPNYRGSTGRGVEFSKMDQADYAEKEFNDLVDGVQHLVAAGLVDEEKVGVTGGSYGGFAAAWCATALTEHFAAAVMSVGISEQISKFGTTDIPNEMFLVHARRWPWDYWDWFRERSPVYYVQKAKTPILILHGKEDTRVHPSQSMILYRYLKTLGQVPVRLVLYPGEGHGNRKAAGRSDYSRRMMRWMEHYLQGSGGEAPAANLDHDAAKLE